MAENKWVTGVVSPQTKWSSYWFWGPPCRIVVMLLEHVGKLHVLWPGGRIFCHFYKRGWSFSLSQVQIKTAEKARGRNRHSTAQVVELQETPINGRKYMGFTVVFLIHPEIFCGGYLLLWKLVTLGNTLYKKTW